MFMKSCCSSYARCGILYSSPQPVLRPSTIDTSVQKSGSVSFPNHRDMSGAIVNAPHNNLQSSTISASNVHGLEDLTSQSLLFLTAMISDDHR